MIDVENEIFNLIANSLRVSFADISVYGEEVQIPSKLPCVTIIEADNSMFDRTLDSGDTEKYTSLMYEINVYSNKIQGKKSECKKIFSVIDKHMRGIGFTRISAVPQTMDNSAIYRIIGRYTSVISKDFKTYRR